MLIKMVYEYASKLAINYCYYDEFAYINKIWQFILLYTCH